MFGSEGVFGFFSFKIEMSWLGGEGGRWIGLVYGVIRMSRVGRGGRCCLLSRGFCFEVLLEWRIVW